MESMCESNIIPDLTEINSFTSKYQPILTLNFLVAVVNTVNTKTHSSKEMAEFFFENADVKSICYFKQKTKSTLSLSSECVETKLCKPCTSFTSHLHSSCGMVWYRTLRVKHLLFKIIEVEVLPLSISTVNKI